MRRMLGLCALGALAACQPPKPAAMSDARKAALGDSVKAVAVGMVDKMNQGDMTSGWTMYSTSADARYVENGMVHASLDEMKKMSEGMAPSMEKMHIDIKSTDAIVLGPDAVLINSPFNMTMKMKGKPEYKAAGVWTGIFHRENGKWEIVSTHESVQHADAMMAAMMPAPTKGAKKPATKAPARRR
jgi:ketosteroid isomerase-like protein